ncbi:bifunctional diguanylate cyclase/phosphodiesterase [Hydrogenophaga sp.]|uniref:sensor domain-containing protein n=1 Tax=Hydrogenophaga sp. TaxID=1904254 RepID=UPI0025BCF88A|nr:bifunctional diguanylate cyclase/phosphodiesterase [Hydrogenophaga sp.]
MAAQLTASPAALVLERYGAGWKPLGWSGLSDEEAKAMALALEQHWAQSGPPTPGAVKELDALGPEWPALPERTGTVQTMGLPEAQAAHPAALVWIASQLASPSATANPLLRILADVIAEQRVLLHRVARLPTASAPGHLLPGSSVAESESRLALTERTAGVGSWSIDVATNHMHYSVECANILGLRELDTVCDLDVMVSRYAPEWRSGIRQRLERCAALGEGFDEEIQAVLPSLGFKWVRTVGEAVLDTRGQVMRIQGAVQDISAQKQAQEETLRLAMRLTTTLASITEAFVTLDRQCCFTYLNQESERLLQKSTADLLGQAVWQDFAGPQAERLREQFTRALTINRRVELEEYFPQLGKWLEVRAYPFAEGLAVYFRDVTERRRSQEQLMLLETSVAQLNDIVVIVETGAATEHEARIVFANNAFEEQTGYTRDEVMGQTPRLLLGLDPAIAKLREMASALQQTRKARTELQVTRKNQTSFWVELEVVTVQADAQAVTHWVAVGRDITQRKTAEDMIRHLALYDPLTDLPNRQLLMERLQKALFQSARSGQHGALMFIDLDNFKIINDTLGHHVGDQLLKLVAIRLNQSVRKTDTVARLGGDEFVVMVDDLSTDVEAAARKAQTLADKVLSMLREPFQIAGHQHYATPSIGVTAFIGQRDDVGELLKQADLAMYQAKSLGRNNVCFFDPVLQSRMGANAAISADLRVALREEQFVVYYQPQVDRQGVITGVEALVRWQHPTQGLVLPGDFIPVAEDSGMILQLGQWVLETACAQLAAWADWPQTAGLSVAVNVSVHQFRHPDFVDMVIGAIRHAGISPQRLKLELTESLLADRMEVTIEKMGMLKALGVTLSLDDFGVGYSSLSVLKRLPLDQLKIDKGFVADVLTDPNDAAISRAIIALAQSLSLQVVAEGVETLEQRDFLAYQGCDQFQGYLFAPPLPIKTLDAHLRNPSSGMMVLV